MELPTEVKDALVRNDPNTVYSALSFYIVEMIADINTRINNIEEKPSPPIVVNIDTTQFAHALAQELRPVFEAFLLKQGGQSGQVDSGQMSSGQLIPQAIEAQPTGGQVVKNVHPKTYSSNVKREVIRQYAETYSAKTHAEIADHFQVSTKTIQRALKG